MELLVNVFYGLEVGEGRESFISTNPWIIMIRTMPVASITHMTAVATDID